MEADAEQAMQKLLISREGTVSDLQAALKEFGLEGNKLNELVRASICEARNEEEEEKHKAAYSNQIDDYLRSL